MRSGTCRSAALGVVVVSALALGSGCTDEVDTNPEVVDPGQESGDLEDIQDGE